MGTIRNFLRKKNLKENKRSDLKLKRKFKTLVVEKYYNVLDDCAKNPMLKSDPQQLWKEVNLQWKEWQTFYMNGLKTSEEKKLFRSIINAAIELLNRDFQELKEDILKRRENENNN